MPNLLATTALILAKKETTYGTDAAPTKAADALLVEGLSMSFDTDLQARPVLSPDLGRRKHTTGLRSATVTFTHRMRTDGAAAKGLSTAPQRFDPLLRACGYAPTYTPETVTGWDGRVVYKPVSTNFDSCTIYVYRSGLLWKFLGCRGNVVFTITAGQDWIATYTFSALYAKPTDTAMPTDPTYLTTDYFLAKKLTLVWGTATPIVQQLAVSLNNDVSLLPALTAEHGIVRAMIVNRDPGGSFNPEAELEATIPFWGDLDALAEKALTVTFGIVVKDKARIHIPKVQLKSIDPGERDGVFIYSVPFAANINTGDDEIELTFGHIA